MSFDNHYYNSEADKFVTQHNLQHWHQNGKFCFITWRMADSLPKDMLDQLRHEKNTWLDDNPRPRSAEQQQLYNKLFTRKLESWLDAGYGSCALADKRLREIIVEALLYRNGKCFDLISFVIMPNHVHLFIQLYEKPTLPEILHSLKRYTAITINRRMKRVGAFWQAEYFDRLVRSEAHFAHIFHYIRNNGKLLEESNYTYWEKPS